MLHLVDIPTDETKAPRTNSQLLSNITRGLNTTTEHLERVPTTGSAANGLASSEEMLSIAGLLDWEPDISAFDNDQLAGSWLWTDGIAQDLDLNGDLQ